MIQSKHESTPLCRIPEGTRVRLHELGGCPKARAKLYAMGLTPGTELEIIQSGSGPCKLRVRGSDLVLGHGMSQKVFACPLGNCPSEVSCNKK